MTISPFHQRVIVLSYFTDTAPKFHSDEEADAYHAAIGRTVLYGLQREATEDTVQLVSIGLLRHQEEFDAAYYRAVASNPPDETGYRPYEGAPLQQLNAYIFSCQNHSPENPFVIGAVKQNGKWGFHS